MTAVCTRDLDICKRTVFASMDFSYGHGSSKNYLRPQTVYSLSLNTPLHPPSAKGWCPKNIEKWREAGRKLNWPPQTKHIPSFVALIILRWSNCTYDHQMWNGIPIQYYGIPHVQFTLKMATSIVLPPRYSGLYWRDYTVVCMHV
jgi:hypothetical protein